MLLVPDVPVTRLLDDAARSFPDAPALAAGADTLTYRQLLAQVDRFAWALTGLGVRRGDRVVLLLPDCPQLVVGVFAVLRIGAVVVTQNPRSTREQLRHQVADCGAEVLVCSGAEFEDVQAIREQTALRTVVVTATADAAGRRLRPRVGGRAPGPRGIDPGTVRSWGQLVRSAATHRPEVSLDPGMVAMLAYTGGTSGPARGAILTHRNLVANAHQCSWWLRSPAPAADVVLGSLPLFHPLGMTLCLTTTMTRAGLLVLVPAGDPGAFVRAVSRFRPTLLPVVPPQLQTLLDDPRMAGSDLSAVRATVAAALPLPADLRQAWLGRAPGADLLEAYGMAETTALTHGRRLGRPGTIGGIGVPLPLTEAKIVGPGAHGSSLPPGRPGELVVRGPQVFSGYWGRPDAANMLLPHGWMRTGDLARVEPDGSYSLLGRMGSAAAAS